MFDNEILIEVQNGTDLRIHDYGFDSETIEHEEKKISRDTRDITNL